MLRISDCRARSECEHTSPAQRRGRCAREGGKEGTHPDLDVLDLGQVRLEVVLALAVLEKLAEGERRRALHPQLGEDAAEREDVHRLGHLAVALAELERVLLARRVGAGGIEALGREVAGAARRRVEVEREGGRVVERQERRLERRGKVGEVGPVPGCDDDVLGLDVAVRDLRACEGGRRDSRVS